MRTAVVGCDHFDVLVVLEAITVAIFDPQIRKMDLLIEVREVVLVRPFADLGIGPIRVSVIVIAAAIALMEPALVLPLELVIEHDALNPRVTLGKPLRGAFVGAVNLDVVFQFPLAFDARPEGLAVTLVAIAMVFEHASSVGRQRHRIVA
jgi:hypothetical protein